METAPGLWLGLGWVRGTLKADAPDGVLSTLRPFFGDGTEREGGTRWYRRSRWLDDRRVMVAWDGIGQAAGTVMVEVKQTALDGLGWGESVALLADLVDLGVRVSRLDVYCDDRRPDLAAPGQVWDALGAGDVVTHAREWQRHEGRHGSGSETVYVGKRMSERLLRVYRKPDELGDRVRWELELHDDRARGFAGLLLASLGDAGSPEASHDERVSLAGRLFWGYVAGFVDFRERGRAAGDGHGAARRPRLAWFADLVDGAARVRARVAVLVDSLERRAAWLWRQVAPSLSGVWAVKGDDWLNGLLDEGLRRDGGRAAGWAR